MIRVENLHKTFKDQEVLRGVNLNCEKAKSTVIIGGSGVGKSVLLKHFIGLLKPDVGSVFVKEQDVSKMTDFELKELRKNFGYLFQDAALFDYMNVFQNVSFPLREHTKLKESKIIDRVKNTLDIVGLKDVDKKMPGELSGGMRKRVGLARAIVLEPEIILYDEPTTGLDPVLTNSIDELIVKTKKKLNITTVVISHDIKSTFYIADKVAMLYDGKIIEEGPPDVFRGTKNKTVQRFLEGTYEGPGK